MATTTTRLGLDKPAYADAADIAVLNQNFDDIDAAVGMKVVTSTTRPATPWDGQLIFETDTNYTLLWDATGAAWKQIGGAATVCTSSTRPASPLNGQIIYETDTRQLLVYSTAATAWRLPFLDYNVADFTALAALTGMISGSRAFVVEGDVSMVFDGGAWIQQSVAKFASTADRDTAYAKASNAYKVQGVQAYVSGTNTTWAYSAAFNSSTNTGGVATAGWYPVNNSVGASMGRTNTSLSISNNTWTTLTFNTFAVNGVTPSSYTTPSTFTIVTPGFYRLHVDMNAGGWSSGSGTFRGVFINKNSTTVTTNALGSEAQQASITSYGVQLTVDALLAANDVIRFWAIQDSGGSATHNATYASIEYLRPAGV